MMFRKTGLFFSAVSIVAALGGYVMVAGAADRQHTPDSRSIIPAAPPLCMGWMRDVGMAQVGERRRRLVR
jgi:hypothetical protein